MTDETTITEKPTPSGSSERVETVTTTSSPSPLMGESAIFGASGRFWIAFLFSFAFAVVVVLSLATGKTPEANLFAAFSATAGMVVGNYMGQNSKPKTQTQ